MREWPSRSRPRRATIAETDAEHEHDGREPDADFEPSEVYAFAPE
jgi:hypothetical protein